MDAKQHIVPVIELARSMLGADDDFADRVHRFEERFGQADDDALGVLSQAAHFCDTNREFHSNVLALCKAVGTGRPTSSFYHCQLSPDWWQALNRYIIGVQRWLGADMPLPEDLDSSKLEAIARWLGKPHPAKTPLGALFLERLIDSLAGTSSAKLGGDVPPDGAPYRDFSRWYLRRDGSTYATGDRAAFVHGCVEKVREATKDAPEDAEALVAGILAEGPPPCVYKYSRYLDIQVSSIGALKWRGNVPPKDDLVRSMDGPLHAEIRAALKSWAEGSPPAGDVARQMHEALGEPTDRKKAVMYGFLNIQGLPGQRDPNEPAFDWLGARDG